MYTPKKDDEMKKFMGEEVKELLKECGEGVKVFPTAKIVSPQRVKVGDHTRFCDYCFIHPEQGEVEIGRYCSRSSRSPTRRPKSSPNCIMCRSRERTTTNISHRPRYFTGTGSAARSARWSITTTLSIRSSIYRVKISLSRSSSVCAAANCRWSPPMNRILRSSPGNIRTARSSRKSATSISTR